MLLDPGGGRGVERAFHVVALRITDPSSPRKFTVTIDLNSGTSGYTVYTSDLSEEYVDFNSAECVAGSSKPCSNA